MSDKAESQGKIKLRFVTPSGQEVLGYRTYSLTNVKNKKATFKSLESILKTTDAKTGEEKSLNNKCAEMDKILPKLMGVSPAVLENVIFCHQDESLWPFSDQANL